MRFKQPRVPQYREGESGFLKILVLFLRDFCHEAWMAWRSAEKALSYCMTALRRPPTDYLGGTWTLIDKQFAHKEWTDGFFAAEAGVECMAQHAVRCGHGIRFYITLQSKDALTDTQAALGVISWEALGAEKLQEAIFLTGAADTGGMALAEIEAGTGAMTHRGAITQGGGMAAGTAIHYSGVMLLGPDEMADSACAAFIWKRTNG